jgi:hypothetical protein
MASILSERCKRPKTPTDPREKGKKMAERQETRQEQETRWGAQRAAHDKELLESQAARRRRTVRNVIVGVIVLIVVVVAVVVLL